MKKRLLCAVFAAAILVTGAMAGCSGGSGTAQNNSQASASQADGDASVADGEPSEAAATGEKLEGLTATKVGRVNIDSDKVEFTANGIIYQGPDGKYGVIGLDGANDTTPKFAKAVEATSRYGFIRVYELVDNENLNTCGLVDNNGVQLIDCKYGYIEILNERYARVFTLGGTTTDKTKTVLSIKDDYVSTSPSEGSTWYTGKWEIFDLKNKALLKDVSGSDNRNEYIIAYGQFVQYKNTNDRKLWVDETGVEVTDGRKIFKNGAYVLEVNGKSAVYSTDGERLFTFDAKDYSVTDFFAYYYVAKRDKKSFLINEQGETVSVEFENTLYKITPDYVVTDKKELLTLDGKKVAEGGSTLYFDTINKDAYTYADSDSSYLVLDAKGGTLLKHGSTKGSPEDFLLYDVASGTTDTSYYNFAEGAYSITGSSTYAPWLVKVKAGELNNLVDVRSGNAILESYANYKAVVFNGKEYVYTFNSINGKSSKGDFDIYTVAK